MSIPNMLVFAFLDRIPVLGADTPDLDWPDTCLAERLAERTGVPDTRF